MKNPSPNPQDLEMLKKASTDGIKLPGTESVTTLPASLVEEAIIVSELFKVRVCGRETILYLSNLYTTSQNISS